MSAKHITMDLLIRYGFHLLGAVVILAVGVLLARWAAMITGRWLERQPMEPPVRTLLVRVVRTVVLLFAAVLALEKFGFHIAPLVAGIGVAGLGIGIALHGVLSNIIAGLSILFTKPFRVGEYIELSGAHGRVVAIELFSTTLAHADQSRVVIPNRRIVGEILHNFGAVRQLDLAVGVAYGTNLDQALAAIREILAGNPRVLRDPAPVVGVTALTDSAMTIGIRPWVSVADTGPASAEIYQAIAEGFRARGIEIPFLQREVRILGGA